MKKSDLLTELKDGNLESEIKYSKKSLINILISLILINIFFVIALVFKNKASKLSFFTVTSLFVLYASIVIINLFLVVIHTIVIKKNKSVFNKKAYYVYSIADLISFLFKIVFYIFFILSFIITPSTVSGISMNDTFHNQDRVLVWHLGYKPKRDDVIVIDINEHYKSGIISDVEEFYIKRVIAVEGDKVDFNNNEVYVNDELTAKNVSKGQYIRMTSTLTETEGDYVSKIIPEGFCVVLGDNRNHSYDSRYIGMIYNSDVLGKVVFRYFSKDLGIGVPKKNFNI